MARNSYRVRKMKYFTPPTTFDALWTEFHQSGTHIKTFILDFFMALSKIFQTISHVLAAVWETVELVAYFLLTILNLIWLILKIILVLGEQIKALGPAGPPQRQTRTPSYYSREPAKFASLKNNLITSTSQASVQQEVQANDIKMEPQAKMDPTSIDTSHRELIHSIKEAAALSKYTSRDFVHSYSIKKETLYSDAKINSSVLSDSTNNETMSSYHPTRRSVSSDYLSRRAVFSGSNKNETTNFPESTNTTRSSYYQRHRTSETGKMNSLESEK